MACGLLRAWERRTRPAAPPPKDQRVKKRKMYPYRQETNARRAPNGARERRKEARHETRLPFSLSLIDERAGLNEAQRAITLTGHTHDISRSGISLIGPLIRFGYRYLMGRESTLRIALELPSGPIEIEATPVRYVQLATSAIDAGFIMSGGAVSDGNVPTEIACLIGVEITGMSPRDRALYDEYLSLLEQVEAEQMSFIVGIEDSLSEEAFLAQSAA